MAVGIWVSVDGTSFLKVFGSLSSSAMQFVNVGYFLIAAGAVLFILGFLGCYGAHSENKCVLMMVCWIQLPRPTTKGFPFIPDTSLWDPKTLLGIVGASLWGTPVCRARKVCCPKTCFIVSTQFFSILLIIFIAEIAGAVVALVYTTLVRHWDGAKGEKLESWWWAVNGYFPYLSLNIGLTHPG